MDKQKGEANQDQKIHEKDCHPWDALGRKDIPFLMLLAPLLFFIEKWLLLTISRYMKYNELLSVNLICEIFF